MPRLRLTSHEAHYQQQGRGRDVLLVHGFTSNLAMWMFGGVTSALARDFRVTSYDLRGHGASSAPARGYTSADLAADLIELHAALELEPAWCVGHSLGGVVAMHAALLAPQCIGGVVLSDSYFPGLASFEPEMPQADVWVQLGQQMAAAGHDIGPTVDFRRLLDAIAILDANAVAVLRERMGAPAARWLSQLRPLAATSAAEEAFLPAGLGEAEIARVYQPVYALYDEHTPFLATWHWLQANLPSCTGARVPGAAHLALLENPSVFIEMVRDWLWLQQGDPRAPRASATGVGE